MFMQRRVILTSQYIHSNSSVPLEVKREFLSRCLVNGAQEICPKGIFCGEIHFILGFLQNDSYSQLYGRKSLMG